MSTGYLVVRLLHIFFGALWLGAGFYASLILLPVVRQMGAPGAQVVSRLVQRGFGRFMAASSGIAVVTGVYLYWRLTGFHADAMHGHAGLVFGVGSIVGIVAFIAGGAVMGRGTKRIAELADAGAGDSPEAAAIHARLSSAGRLIMALLFATLTLMVIGYHV